MDRHVPVSNVCELLLLYMSVFASYSALQYSFK